MPGTARNSLVYRSPVEVKLAPAVIAASAAVPQRGLPLPAALWLAGRTLAAQQHAAQLPSAALQEEL